MELRISTGFENDAGKPRMVKKEAAPSFLLTIGSYHVFKTLLTVVIIVAGRGTFQDCACHYQRATIDLALSAQIFLSSNELSQRMPKGKQSAEGTNNLPSRTGNAAVKSFMYHTAGRGPVVRACDFELPLSLKAVLCAWSVVSLESTIPRHFPRDKARCIWMLCSSR